VPAGRAWQEARVNVEGPMILYPAIDLKDGKAVRLVHGEMDRATVFNDDPANNKVSAQEYFEDRLSYCMAMLREYALAFRQIRASGATSLETYTSGM